MVKSIVLAERLSLYAKPAVRGLPSWVRRRMAVAAKVLRGQAELSDRQRERLVADLRLYAAPALRPMPNWACSVMREAATLISA